MKPRSCLSAFLSLAIGVGFCCLSNAQDVYPKRQVRLVIPQAAGGGGDILGRIYANYLSQSLGQAVFVDNKPGANGLLASSYVAKQPADGYTLMMAGISQLAINPFVYKALPYNPEKDFEGIGLLVNTPFILLSSNASGIKSFADLVRTAKTKPNVLNFASAGTGNSTHLVMEMLAKRSDFKVTHVPFGGTAPALQSVVADQTQLMTDVLAHGASNAKAGSVQALAVVGSKRTPMLPEVPTLDELGFKDFPIPGWYAIVAPAGTPAAVVNRLNAETVKFLTDPKIIAELENLSFEPLPSKPAAVKEWTQRDARIWGPLVQQLGIRND